MKNFVSIGLGLLAFPAVASAHLGESRNMWENEMKKRCPDHHVDWVGDGEYPALIDAYDATLSAKLRNDLKKIAKYSRTCSKEIAGYSCEWAVHIYAIQRLNLLSNFAYWTCENVYCKEPTFCKIS
jgi:hypothetical protein